MRGKLRRFRHAVPPIRQAGPEYGWVLGGEASSEKSSDGTGYFSSLGGLRYGRSDF